MASISEVRNLYMGLIFNFYDPPVEGDVFGNRRVDGDGEGGGTVLRSPFIVLRVGASVFGFDVENLAEGVRGGGEVDKTVGVEIGRSNGEFSVGRDKSGLASGGVGGDLILKKARRGS